MGSTRVLEQFLLKITLVFTRTITQTFDALNPIENRLQTSGLDRTWKNISQSTRSVQFKLRLFEGRPWIEMQHGLGAQFCKVLNKGFYLVNSLYVLFFTFICHLYIANNLIYVHAMSIYILYF